MPRITQLSRSIEGRVAIVTGAGSGMGRATAHLFADEGAKVAAVDVTPGGAQAVAAEISRAGGVARPWAVDVSDRQAVEKLIAEVVAEFGGLDILVNNAGISAAGPIDSAESFGRSDVDDARALRPPEVRQGGADRVSHGRQVHRQRLRPARLVVVAVYGSRR